MNTVNCQVKTAFIHCNIFELHLTFWAKLWYNNSGDDDMADETVNRRSKDSLFVDIFSDISYVLRLYKDLHPEDTDVTAEDINIQTIKSVLVNTMYNDLGFFVRDKFIVLVEAQSVWNPNIPLRMLFYLSETYRRYLADTEQSEHTSTPVKLPVPELYVIYSGEKNVPGEISLAQDLIGGVSPVDVRVRVLCSEDAETISGQYVGFCRVFDSQRKIYENKLECIRTTMDICSEKGYLASYLRDHRKEAFTMMSELFDEEYLRERYNAAEKKKNLTEGIAIGENKKANAVAKKLRKMGMSEEQISEIISS